MEHSTTVFPPYRPTGPPLCQIDAARKASASSALLKSSCGKACGNVPRNSQICWCPRDSNPVTGKMPSSILPRLSMTAYNIKKARHHYRNDTAPNQFIPRRGYSAFTQRIEWQSCAFTSREPSTDRRLEKAAFTRVLSSKVKTPFLSAIQ